MGLACTLAMEGFGAWPFQPLGADFFACDAGACLHFRRDGAGEVGGVMLDVNRASALELERG